ncbi:MAG: bifunctional folylpolyglutamate synthase/dihydrofolate synthase [Gemmatimonadota bacterium]|nr:bifunctional folylpolyglutamate synthase/dihydrofolate synthase [Gemmatimonadota bacterium]
MELALTTYRDALQYLFARTTGGWRLGLDRTTSLLSLLERPHLAYPVFHVGGTNGKGSVVATLDALLRAAGWRVGRYTSPHLIDFRERILVDGQPIAEDAVTAWVERWTPDVERLGATFFEATTSMAFDFFAREEVDVAVIEVGLGGRLDSTNVVMPLVAAVTSIGLDHTQFLGGTVEQIAAEKAGIFKAGRPAVIGEPDARVRARLAQCAREAGSDPVIVMADRERIEDVSLTTGGTQFAISRAGARRRLRTPLIGAHQAANAALALTMLDAAGPPFAAAALLAESALDGVHLPGRFQRVGSLILDVAHNPASVEVLGKTLEAVRPPRPLVALVSVLDDKDWRAMLDTLAPLVERFVLTTAPSAPVSRTWELKTAVAHAARHGYAVDGTTDFGAALDHARAGAATTLVTGSFHTVGDAMRCLQLSPFVA